MWTVVSQQVFGHSRGLDCLNRVEGEIHFRSSYVLSLEESPFAAVKKTHIKQYQYYKILVSRSN